MQFTTVALAALMGVAQAVDVQVVYVGKNPVNNASEAKYWPSRITAEPGTMVQFQFWAGNHTVTQSSFADPCQPMAANSSAAGNATGAPVRSGFQPVEASEEMGMIPTWSIMINDTAPLWLYCAQAEHCANGMSMVINENEDSENTLTSYRENAASAAGVPPPEEGPGGVPTGGSDGGAGGGADGGAGGDAGGEDDSSEIPAGDGADDEAVQAGAAQLVATWSALLTTGLAVMLM